MSELLARKVALHSIGCRTNQEELEALSVGLQAAGFCITEDLTSADIVIVNTCSVTSFTESKTRRFLNGLSRSAPQAKLLITGCFAQQKGAILKENPQVKWIVGNGEKQRIVSILKSELSGCFLSDVTSLHTLPADTGVGDPISSGRTRFSLKIQEGCDFRCAYCIVPALRGKSRSAPSVDLNENFRRAVDAGFKEIVITGTHIGQYRNAEGSKHLVELLESFFKNDGDYRIRLSSLDPRDLSDDLISLMTSEAKLCPHLHISIQSFSPDVLKAMKRPYSDLESLMGRIESFRNLMPTAGLGADFIVGFPGETELMFELTLQRVQKLGFTYGHVFRFSKRPGTEASQMSEQVSESEKSRRSEMLRSTLLNSRVNFLCSLSGKPLRIIVEKEHPVRGTTDNFIKVEIPGIRAGRNTWLTVFVENKTQGGHCLAGIANGETL